MSKKNWLEGTCLSFYLNEFLGREETIWTNFEHGVSNYLAI